MRPTLQQLADKSAAAEQRACPRCGCQDRRIERGAPVCRHCRLPLAAAYAGAAAAEAEKQDE